MKDRLGLVIEGGGMRAIYVAGVLDVFMEHELSFDGVVGISAGAIHGSNFVAGQKGRTIRYYKKYCADKKMIGLRNLILTGNIVNNRFFYHDLPDRLDPFDYEAFQDSATEFYAGCTNVETGGAEYIRIKDMKADIDALRASSSLPYVSTIVDFKGMKLLDGAFADSIPVNAFRQMGYRKNVVILSQHDGFVKKPEDAGRARRKYKKYPKFVETIAHRHEVYNQTLKDLKEYQAAGEVFVIYPSEPLTLPVLGCKPEELQKVYDIGVKDAKNLIEDLKRWISE